MSVVCVCVYVCMCVCVCARARARVSMPVSTCDCDSDVAETTRLEDKYDLVRTGGYMCISAPVPFNVLVRPVTRVHRPTDPLYTHARTIARNPITHVLARHRRCVCHRLSVTTSFAA